MTFFVGDFTSFLFIFWRVTSASVSAVRGRNGIISLCSLRRNNYVHQCIARAKGELSSKERPRKVERWRSTPNPLPPSKFQSGDLVARLDTSEDAGVDDCYPLYRIAEVPLGQFCKRYRRDEMSIVTNQFWDDNTFTTNTMAWFDPRMIYVILVHARSLTRA